jgi:hypothetical protein
MVRLHQLDPAPTLEGILTGVPAGHYRLLKPSLVSEPGQTHRLESPELLVPRERVVFVEVLS